MKRNRPQAPEDGGRMSLAGHLGELRKRAAVCAAALALCFLVCLGFAGPLVNALTGLGRAYGYRFVYLAPQELLLVYCNLALTGALALSFKYILRHTAPALAREAAAQSGSNFKRLHSGFDKNSSASAHRIDHKVIRPYSRHFSHGGGKRFLDRRVI